jgi:ATP-dependent RNA helicase DeaD
MIYSLTSFESFNISNNLKRAISEMGFTQASEIQARAIPILLEGRDIIGQAQTGTGKTAAFAIPGVELLDSASRNTQILVLCPTRELVVQVSGEFEKLTKHHENISVVAIYGGQDIGIQLKSLKKSAQIVVGTPGRVMDHLRRGTLRLDAVKYLVLDEADQMLDMGFLEDMEVILGETPNTRQTVMFSATMSRELMALMNEFQKNAKHINVIGQKEQSSQINQIFFHINGSVKLEALKRLLAYYKIKSALIFCNTKIKVDELAKELSAERYSTASLHGDMDQKRRDRVMEAFKHGSIEILIATDVAARGIDVNDLEAVINYDLPRFDQDYVHRIGRTGRAGKEGLALTFVVGKEIEHINRIARKNNMIIEKGKIPEIQDLEKNNIDAIKALVAGTEFPRRDLQKYLSYVNQLEMFDYSPEELSALLLKVLLDQETKSFGGNINFEPERSSSKPRNRNRPRAHNQKAFHKKHPRKSHQHSRS